MIRPLARYLTAVALLTFGGIPASAGFVVVDLGVLPGGSFSQGNAINDGGMVVGNSTIGFASQRAFKGGNSSPVDLGTLKDGNFSSAFAINDSGIVAGDSEIKVDGVLRTHAFRSLGSGGLIDMGTMGDDIASAARGINSSGHVAGWSTAAGGRTQAVIGFAPNAFTAVGDLGGMNSKAFAINDSDAVVGHAETGAGSLHAFLTIGGKTTDLGTLIGSDGSSARGINNANDVVGYTTGAVAHAFLSRGGAGPLLDLGLLPFSTWSRAFGVNDERLIVGESGGDSGGQSAFLWTPSGGMYDLNHLISPTSGWQLLSASAINNGAQITGYGIVGGQLHGYRLDPIPGQPLTQPPSVPEPATAVLLVAGGLGFAVRCLILRVRAVRAMTFPPHARR